MCRCALNFLQVVLQVPNTVPQRRLLLQLQLCYRPDDVAAVACLEATHRAVREIHQCPELRVVDDRVHYW